MYINAQIINSVVRPITVCVTCFHAIRSRSNKCYQHKDMDFGAGHSPVAVHGYFAIAILIRHDFTLSPIVESDCDAAATARPYSPNRVNCVTNSPRKMPELNSVADGEQWNANIDLHGMPLTQVCYVEPGMVLPTPCPARLILSSLSTKTKSISGVATCKG